MTTQDTMPKVDTEQATLDWLVSALDYVRSKGQTRVVGYLEEVADEVVFEEFYADGTKEYRRAERLRTAVRL